MKTIIFGGNGQLGHELTTQLQARAEESGIEIVSLTRQQCDVTDFDQLQEAFAAHAPAMVFNATAYNAVDKAEDEPDEAMRLNALVPAQMALLCSQVGAGFVHYSTDYVFGAGYSSPISELETPTPISVYGKSKLLGEQMVLQNHPTDSFVIRCCGLYGERRANFVRTMVRCALQGRALRVVSDQFISPTWVKPLAHASLELLMESERAPRGVYHVVTQGACSWYEYAAAIFDILDLDADLSSVLQSEWAAPAPRPAYSVLDNAKLRLLGLDSMPDWHACLESFLEAHGQQLVEDVRAELT